MYRGPNSAEETYLLNSRILNEIFMTKDNIEAVKSFLRKELANSKAPILKTDLLYTLSGYPLTLGKCVTNQVA